MIDDRVSAVSVGCLVGLLVCWQTLEESAAGKLTFRDWVLGVLAGVAVGGATGLVGYALVRRFNGGDDEEDE